MIFGLSRFEGLVLIVCAATVTAWVMFADGPVGRIRGPTVILDSSPGCQREAREAERLEISARGLYTLTTRGTAHILILKPGRCIYSSMKLPTVTTEGEPGPQVEVLGFSFVPHRLLAIHQKAQVLKNPEARSLYKGRYLIAKVKVLE